MGIILKNNEFNIKLESNIINGIITNKDILSNMDKKNISFIEKEYYFETNKVLYEMMLYYNKDNFNDVINMLLNRFNLDKDFINLKINDLSNGNKKILKYLLMILDNKKIMIIDEPFQDLDYRNKKLIISILNEIIRSNNKTIIIKSIDSNVIYSLCKKVLIIKNDYLYDNINILEDRSILNKYEIEEPLIVKFVNYAKDKKILIDYSKDIRDLIKDVYKCV